MKNGNLEEILALGNKEPTIVSINHQHRQEITLKQMTDVMMEMKKHLSKRKNVHLVLVKE